MAARFVTRSPFVIRPHPHLYEINTWAWLEELSLRLGRRITLAEVPDAGVGLARAAGIQYRVADGRLATEH